MSFELPGIATIQLPILVILTARLAGFFVTVPFFSTSAAPPLVRGGLALAVALLLYPVHVDSVEVTGTASLVAMTAKELLAGMFLGGLVRLLFAGLQLAGQLAGFGIGLSLAKIIDPGAATEDSLGPALYQYLGLILFIGVGGHRELISAVIRSYDVLPLGAATVGPALVREVLSTTGQMFQAGLRLAAPVAAVLFLVDIVLALGNRVVPQIPILMVGMPVKAWLGIAALGLGLRAFAGPALGWLSRAPDLILGASRLLAVSP